MKLRTVGIALDLFTMSVFIGFVMVFVAVVVKSLFTGYPFMFIIHMNLFGEGWPELVMLTTAIAGGLKMLIWGPTDWYHGRRGVPR